MKLLYCINATYNSGGMERVLMNKTNYWVNKGYDVVIVTTEQAGRKHFFLFSEKIKFIDLDINYSNADKKCLLLRFVIKWYKRLVHRKRLTQILNTEHPDIAISMFDYDFSFLYKINDGSKKILEFHFSKNIKRIEADNRLMYYIQQCRIWYWKRIVRKYSSFVVLTEEDKNAWNNINNIKVIPNSISSIPAECSSLNQKIVCSIGRLVYQKGFDLLIKAWKIVAQKFPDWQLHIIGRGNSEYIYTLINEYNLSKSVIVKPATSQICLEYLNSSLYVMSSRYEGFGMVLIEAMSYGLPIVSFACPCGPRDIISDDFGTLVQPGNIQQLADALITWMSNDIKRKMGGQAARVSVQRFLEKNVMKQWEELFDSLLEQK